MAVLLLHGVPGSRSTWRSVAALIAEKHRVIAPDLIGFGDAPPLPHNGFHAAEEAAFLGPLIERENLERIHLVGFDFGGPTAVALLDAMPERFSSLTLIATNTFTDTPIPPLLRSLRVPILGEFVARAMFSRVGTALLYIGATHHRSEFRFGEFWRSCGNAKTRRSSRMIFIDSLRNLSSRYARVEEALAKIEMPTAVIWGDRDPFFPPAQARRTAGAIRGASLIMLEECGHFVPQERPRELAAVLLEFFEDVEESSVPPVQRIGLR